MDSQSATLTQPTNVISQRQGPADSELPIMISPLTQGSHYWKPLASCVLILSRWWPESVGYC